MSTVGHLDEDNNNKKRSSPMTFRLPEKLVGDLKSEADHEKVSLNTLVNQVFDKHVAWDRYSSKLGLIPMTRAFIKETIEYLPDQKIKEIANNAGKEALKELVLIAMRDLSLGSFLLIFNEWLNASCITYRYENDGKLHKYVVHHRLGEKWSLYLSELVKGICSELSKVEPEVQIRQDSVLLSIKSS